MKKVIYTSQLFYNEETDRCLQFLVDFEALKYYQKRDTAVLKLKKLGGIHAPDTEEARKYRRQIVSANRAIERGGYYAEVV